MSFSLIPMLAIQRELYDLPRGPSRFQQYLELIIRDDNALAFPLSHLNPMAKGHIHQMLDQLIELGAETIATTAVAEANHRLPNFQPSLQISFVTIDDRQGGWTNRYLTDMQFRFEARALLNRDCVVVPLWASEQWDPPKIYEAVLISAYRALYFQHCGRPKTLRQMMAQEGHAAAFALSQTPQLDPEDLQYSQQVIRPYLEANDYPTLVTCLYGDTAAKSLGYPPMGLSINAGYAVALAQAQQASRKPETALLGTCAL